VLVMGLHQLSLGIGSQLSAVIEVPGTWTAPTIAATGALAEGTTSATVVIPAGYLTDDIGFLIVDTANEAVTTPAGWTALTAQGVGTAAAGSAVRCSTFWKRFTAGAETNPTIGTTTDHICGLILLVRGCPNSAAPVMQEAGGTSGSTLNVPFNFEALTTTLDNALIVHAVSRATDSINPQFSAWTNANLTGLAEVFDGGTALGLGGGLGVAAGVMAVAGSIGATSVTPSQGGNVGRQTVSFRPTFFPS
jgi:hypothetical protein